MPEHSSLQLHTHPEHLWDVVRSSGPVDLDHGELPSHLAGNISIQLNFLHIVPIIYQETFHIEQVKTRLFIVIIYRDPIFPFEQALGDSGNEKLPFNR